MGELALVPLLTLALLIEETQNTLRVSSSRYLLLGGSEQGVHLLRLLLGIQLFSLGHGGKEVGEEGGRGRRGRGRGRGRKSERREREGEGEREDEDREGEGEGKGRGRRKTGRGRGRESEGLMKEKDEEKMNQ